MENIKLKKYVKKIAKHQHKFKEPAWKKKLKKHYVAHSLKKHWNKNISKNKNPINE